MGSESYVHLVVGEARIISRVDPHRRFVEGQDTEMALLLGKAHLFDAQSGALLI
jgi:hypothetical protein